jgi:hypothetical protein
MTPKMKEALKSVLQKIENMSPEEFREELDKHKSGDIALALDELQQFSDFLHEYHEKQETDSSRFQ